MSLMIFSNLLPDTDDEDREKWLEILGNVCSRFNWRCHAYCQMDNHYHIHKRKIPKSLEYYERKYKNQKLAIYKAYLSGGYTLKEIGDHFQKHYSTISRIVKGNVN